MAVIALSDGPSMFLAGRKFCWAVHGLLLVRKAFYWTAIGLSIGPPQPALRLYMSCWTFLTCNGHHLPDWVLLGCIWALTGFGRKAAIGLSIKPRQAVLCLYMGYCWPVLGTVAGG